MHATRLSAFFSAILLTAAASSCGAKVDEPTVAGDGGDGDKPDEGDPCAPNHTVDSGVRSCAIWTVPFESPALCTDAGAPSLDDCPTICAAPDHFDGNPLSCGLSTDGYFCAYACTVDGRRPARALEAPQARGCLGDWFARMAFFEAASIQAFADLAHDLRAHGAPSSILRSITRAIDDERRHAKLAGALAQKFGAQLEPCVVEPTRERTLLELARENAIEGCGRECFGALVGRYQAQHAATPELRAFYAQIARDETRHAALSLRLHAWFIERLPEHAGELERLRLGALRNMTVDCAPPELGLPDAATIANFAVQLAT